MSTTPTYQDTLVASYDQRARQYRRDDEIEVQSENHHRIGGNIRRVCRSFSQPARVLEIGCGTGRYFHWFRNVKLLVGTDLSAEMLACARHPVKSEEVTIDEIRLIQGNLYDMRFAAGSFDFICSLGVFGYGAALTDELCVRFHDWLAPGGRLYIDAIERKSDPPLTHLRRRARPYIYPLLPRRFQSRLDQRQRSAVPLITHSRTQIEQSMTAGGFLDFAISTNICSSPLWTGVHLECLASKLAEAGSPAGSIQEALASA